MEISKKLSPQKPHAKTQELNNFHLRNSMLHEAETL